MPKQSAGLLLYRNTVPKTEVFLVHPGGPYFFKKDDGVWSIPKGEFNDNEDALQAAIREFAEETGQHIEGNFTALTTVKQKGGKLVYCWAVAANIDADNIKSNTFKMEYPYKSGRWISVPEIDRAAWFDTDTAIIKINPAQAALVKELLTILNQG